MFKVHHIAISVSDIKKSVDFYSFFGFKKILDWKDENGDLKIVHLKLKDFLLEIFSFKNFQILPKNSQKLETDLPEIWVKHFWLQVDDIEKIKEILIEKKFAENIEIKMWRTWIKYFFIKDPDGILLEIVEDKRWV